MAEVYIELAFEAPFSEIVDFWDVYSWLDWLFEANIIEFETAAISFSRPTKIERGVNALMVEINYVVRDLVPMRKLRLEICRRYPESRFNAQSAMEYGFGKLSPWERCQMMVLLDNIEPRRCEA